LCGICAVYNVKGANKILSQILLDQESRGRDATGIAYILNNELKVFKKAIPPSEFIKLIKNNSNIKIGIGHNRAATSNVQEKNKDKEAHPFLSETKEFVLCHNGSVIGDSIYRDLLSNFLNHEFSSGVDSEIFVHLLEELLAKYKNNRYKAIKEFFKIVRGNVLVLFKDGELFGFPDTSSFIVILLDNSLYVASEPSSLSSILNNTKAKKVRCLIPESSKDNQMIRVITKNNKVVLDIYGDWEEEILKEDSWRANRRITCDVCKVLKTCERIKYKNETIDRCYDCYKENKFPETTTTTTQWDEWDYPYSRFSRRFERPRIQKSDEEKKLEKETKVRCSICSEWFSFNEVVHCTLCNQLMCKDCYYSRDHLCKVELSHMSMYIA